MKKYGIYFVICCFLICFVCSPVAASSVSVGDQLVSANSCHGIDAGSSLLGSQKIVDNAKAVMLYEATSDTLMYAWNADEKMHPANIVKILTALIAAERGNCDDVVTVNESAIAAIPFDAISADLVAGEQLSLEELLYCLLVGSANDAAVVIAEHISGSHSAFVNEMNTRAQAIGCTGTQFTNAHGLHDDAQFTTARDAARILDAAMNNEVFRTVFTTIKHTVPATNKSSERALSSSNSLMDASSKLYYDPRVIGGRTGVTGDGRRCLASVAENNGMRLICVVMGSDTVYQEDGYSAITIGGYHETTKLLDAGLDGYKAVQVLFANQSIRQFKVADGDSDVIAGPQISVSAVLPDSVTVNDLSMRYSDEIVQAPVASGEQISSVEIWYGNMCVAQAELYAMNSVNHKDTLITAEDSQGDQGVWKIAIWIVVPILLVLFLVFIVPRLVHKLRLSTVRKRSKIYRRSRRRSR
jgi:D-alanyl-D-alanine carboxypeptidase (penicillin-binding protein 5/6)